MSSGSMPLRCGASQKCRGGKPYEGQMKKRAKDTKHSHARASKTRPRWEGEGEREEDVSEIKDTHGHNTCHKERLQLAEGFGFE